LIRFFFDVQKFLLFFLAEFFVKAGRIFLGVWS
jgi:hypothetical protein